jgi:hypothetical protein
MRAIVFFLIVFTTCAASADLIARWKGADFRDAVGRHRLSFSGGATSDKKALEFTGAVDGVAYTPDAPEFRLTESLSISCWVYPRALTSPFATSPAAQIMFRGDDRSGLDPYHLTIARNGRFIFAIASAENNVCAVSATAKLFTWSHLLGTLDDNTGKMRLYVNGKLEEETVTEIRPLAELHPDYNPGFSIGNTQFPAGGMHRQPFDGFIRDARVYNEAVTPRTAMR